MLPMQLGGSLGSYTVADARDDESVRGAIGEVTGLGDQQIRERLSAAHGRTLVRNEFREEWPLSGEALGNLSTAFARNFGLSWEIRRVTRASKSLVTRRLNASHGKKLLRNTFWDHWPDDQEEDERGPAEAWAEEAADVREDPSGTSDADDTEASQDDHDPREIGSGTLLSERYEIREQLGKGGFGTSWLAYDRLAKLDLVLKVPHADDGGAIRNELARAFRIVHPNICQAFPDRDDDTGKPFLVMQHGGTDVARKLETLGQPFPLSLAVHVLVSIADALDYLHEQHVLHLDVSPGNILIDDEDVVRLTDFGASSRARAARSPDGAQTKMATSIHSMHLYYSAPEVFRREARSRSDQYSLFRVFCSLLEGKIHNSPHYQVRPFDVLSEAQNAIVARALSHDPECRFESCSEPARALADDLAHAPQSVLVADLNRIAEHLVHRVALEQRRIASATVRLGGALKLGRGLERLLQATLVWLGSADGFDPIAALRQVDPHATTIDRSTSGKIANTIMARANARPTATTPLPRVAAAVIDDLPLKRRSRLWALVNARNDVVHGRRAPEALLPAAIGVAELLANPSLSAQTTAN